MEDFYEVGQDFFGVDDAALPDVVASCVADLVGVVIYLADLRGTKFGEAWVGLEELTKTAVVAGVDPEISIGCSEKDTLSVEREATLAGIISPEVVSAGIVDSPSDKAIASGYVPCTRVGSPAEYAGSLVDAFGFVD